MRSTPHSDTIPTSCLVRGCTGSLFVHKTLVQDGTKQKSHILKCSEKPAHRVWYIELTKAVLKLQMPRFGWRD